MITLHFELGATCICGIGRTLGKQLECPKHPLMSSSSGSLSISQDLSPPLAAMSIRKRGAKGSKDEATSTQRIAAALSALDACADPVHHASAAACSQCV